VQTLRAAALVVLPMVMFGLADGNTTCAPGRCGQSPLGIRNVR
jgi:hypothetical protein